MIDPSEFDGSDVISYRTLVRGDFKGERPPAAFARYIDRLGAATCAYLSTSPDTQLMIEPSVTEEGEIRYRATAHHVRFHAQMDRNCSWWNPQDVGLSERYLLQHEQIHFALFEIGTRAMNSSVREIKARIDATSEHPDTAARNARRQLKAYLQSGLAEILARSREFDEDTSMGHHPEEQQRWWVRVQSELSLSTGGSVPGRTSHAD